MRWTIISIAAAIALILLGFYVTSGDNMNVAQKACYWLVVTAYVSAESFHFLTWVRTHDL